VTDRTIVEETVLSVTRLAPSLEVAGYLPQRVILIDGTRLTDLMIEHDVGVKVSRIITFKRVDKDFFAEDE